MSGECRRCGSPGSPSGDPAACGVCQAPLTRLSAAGVPVAAASWMASLRGSEPFGDLGAILRAYRYASRLTQQQLADLLGFDRTYISMIECGRRSITDRGTLTYIARRLAIPPHVLGIASPDDADFAAMLAFGTSVIRPVMPRPESSGSGSRCRSTTNLPARAPDWSCSPARSPSQGRRSCSTRLPGSASKS